MSSGTNFCSREDTHDWTSVCRPRAHWRDREREFKKQLLETWIYPQAQIETTPEETTEQAFVRLAEEWTTETAHVSSMSDLVNNAKYRQIIALGLDVLPFLLLDLERNERFWFPALAAITGILPFDRVDAGNYRNMKDAWLRWGKRKGLI